MAVLEADVQVIEQAEFVEPVDPAELQTEYLDSLHRLSLDDYHWMISAGFFQRDQLVADRVELIDGHLVDMSPNRPPHASTVAQLNSILHDLLHGRASVRCQLPITLAVQQSEPEPDIAIVNSGRRYTKEHPSAEDVLLVCEVADSSLTYDRKVKFDLYARAGIREYWIVNLNDRVVEVYRQPVTIGRRATYQLRLELFPNQTIAPLAFPDVEIALSEIFPEREAD
ncbi:MAG: Uma2 family endonuclease [Caldilinea sp.]